ncbi:MAG: tripartite tricarboxylate transporter permease [Methanoregulaceae archaeon]
MLEIALGVLAGIALGTVSGLVPGVHANTMAGILLGLSAILLPIFGPVALAAAMFSALITHTFLDIIPSTFLGIPDADTALSVLPAHALCLEGKGEEAVRIAALGSASAIIIAVPVTLLCFLFLPALQSYFDWGIGLLLLAVVGYLIVTGESPAWAFLIFLVSGILGVFSLHYSYLSWHAVGGSSILMPLLAGLFGISVLLVASKGPVPDQKFDGLHIGRPAILKGSLLGTCAGVAVGWLPGLSTATANGVLASAVGGENNRREYLFATSAANTANAFTGLAALFALDRIRNGVMAAIATLNLNSMAILMIVGVAAAFLAYLLTIGLARSAWRFGGIDGTLLNHAVIVFVTILCFVFTGPFGLLVLALAILTGLTAQAVNIPRIYCMGAIMLPVMLYSFGFGIF